VDSTSLHPCMARCGKNWNATRGLHKLAPPILSRGRATIIIGMQLVGSTSMHPTTWVHMGPCIYIHIYIIYISLFNISLKAFWQSHQNYHKMIHTCIYACMHACTYIYIYIYIYTYECMAFGIMPLANRWAK
jgi:hypothetical protein